MSSTPPSGADGGQFRGTAVVSLSHWCAEQDPEAWTRVLDAFGNVEREQLRRALAFSWLPTSLYPRLVRSCLAATGEVSLQRSFEAGRWIGDFELPVIHRILLQFLRPETLVQKSLGVWKHHHDTGTWRVEEHPTGIRGELCDWAVVDQIACMQVGGYIDALVRRVAAPGYRLRHDRCRARGDDVCSFDLQLRDAGLASKAS